MGPRAPALLRGLAIIEQVLDARGPVTFGELQDSLAMPKATLIRLLAVLREEQFLRRGPAGWEPGPRLALLRSPVGLARRLQAGCQPWLRDLAQRTRCTALLLGVDGELLTALGKVLHPAGATLRQVGDAALVGWRGPWDWIVLRELSAESYDDLVCAQRPPADLEQRCRSEWRRLQEEGFTYDDGILHVDTRRLAAPIHDGERLLGVLALGGRPDVVGPRRFRRLGGELVASAASLRRKILHGVPWQG